MMLFYKLPIVRFYKYTCIIVLLLSTTASAWGKIQLPSIFSDNMVLQRGKPVRIWGKGEIGSQVKIELAGFSTLAIVGNEGKWEAYLPTMVASGPFKMRISDADSDVNFTNIMIGDVWLASGQSNMAFSMKGASNSKDDIKNFNPNIRFFSVPNKLSLSPQDDIAGPSWKLPDTTTVKDFSAVAYYFGNDIQRDQNVTIGLIKDVWSGTSIEAWISQEMSSVLPQMKRRIDSFYSQNLNDDSICAKDARTGINWVWADASYEGLKKGVTKLNYRDSKWKQMEVPHSIEEIEGSNYQGVYWFRKEIVLPQSMVGKDLILSFGQMDIAATVYVNEIEIGRTNMDFDLFRSFEIKSNLVKSAKNLIVIRLCDMWGKGGLLGPVDSLYISTKDKTQKVSISGTWKYKDDLEPKFLAENYFNRVPGLIFNAQVSPIISYNMTGVLWYQGEGNAHKAYEYRTLLPMLINDWRIKMRQGNLPFLIVQLPGYESNQYQELYEWAEMREAQLLTLAYPNTGLAVTADINNPNILHPPFKKEIGKRLALLARSIAYKEKIVCMGPIYDTIRIENEKVYVRFKNTSATKLATTDNSDLKGFEIASDDKIYHSAKAEINGNEVVVTSQEVVKPVAVRYGWANRPQCNLINSERLPASPFRSDDWERVKYKN